MRVEAVYELRRAGGKVPACAGRLAGRSEGARVLEKKGTGGRGVESSEGASFSLVDDWEFGGGSSVSGKPRAGRSRASSSAGALGGVEATTSGLMLNDRGAGRGMEGKGKSLWTI